MWSTIFPHPKSQRVGNPPNDYFTEEVSPSAPKPPFKFKGGLPKFGLTPLLTAVASFTKEVNSRLAKRPLVSNGRLANRGLTSLVKESTAWMYLRNSKIRINFHSKIWARRDISAKNVHSIDNIICTSSWKNSKLRTNYQFSLELLVITFCFYATATSEKSTFEISAGIVTKWGVTAANSVTAIKHKCWK